METAVFLKIFSLGFSFGVMSGLLCLAIRTFRNTMQSNFKRAFE